MRKFAVHLRLSAGPSLSMKSLKILVEAVNRNLTFPVWWCVNSDASLVPRVVGSFPPSSAGVYYKPDRVTTLAVLPSLAVKPWIIVDSGSSCVQSDMHPAVASIHLSTTCKAFSASGPAIMLR